MSAASDAATLASLMPADSRTAQLARMRLDVAVRDERNAMTTIYAPDPTVSGLSYLGPTALRFTNGVAEVDLGKLTDGAKDYLRRTGYGIGEPASPRVGPEPSPMPITSLEREALAAATPTRDDVAAAPLLVGTPLRDAAVDPHPSDFPGVPNAGEPGQLGNPHGPNVRAIEVGSREWAAAVAEQRGLATDEARAVAGLPVEADLSRTVLQSEEYPGATAADESLTEAEVVAS